MTCEQATVCSKINTNKCVNHEERVVIGGK